MSRQGWRWARYVLPYWEVVTFALTSMIAMAVTPPLLAALVRPIIDGVFIDKDQEILQLVLVGVVALFTARGLVGYVATYAVNWVGSKITEDLRLEMFEKLLGLPGRYFSTHSAGDLIFTMVSGTEQVARAGIAVVTVAVKDTITIFCLLGWAFYLNWQLTAVILSMTALIALMARLIARRCRRMRPEMMERMEGIVLVLKESIENYATVRLYRGQEYETHRAREQVSGIHRFSTKRLRVAALAVPLVQMTIGIALAVLIYYASEQAAIGEMTTGGFASLVTAFAMLAAPFGRLSSLKESLHAGLDAGHDIFSLLDERTEPESHSTTVETVRGELRFERVSSRDFQRARLTTEAEQETEVGETLHEISLTVHPGEMVAVVGFQESSITAFVNLVPLLFHPSGGKIFVDGTDLEEINLASLHASIALVSADPPLFNDTLAANIAYGEMVDAPEAEVMAAAYAANVSEFARKLPEGMQTPVGTRGVKGDPSIELSAGQRFRIAVARALLKNSPILIVDEASEALHADYTPQVEAAMEAVSRGRTTLVVARRLSTVEKADRVILLHRSRIAAIGSHGDLLVRDKIYARLARTFK